jgi:Icc-related predicted phosphoesterase
MKILAIGDFHGKFPEKLRKLAKDVDLIVSVGDYPPFHYRKIWFKYCYGKDVELWEFIGRKRYRKLVLEDYKRGERVLEKLNKLKVPVCTVLGNIDYPVYDDIADEKSYGYKSSSMPNYDRKDTFAKRLKKYKNLFRFDYSYFKFKNYVFIGMRGHSSRGSVKSKAFRKHKAILDKLFKKFKKENKEGKVIFVSHNILYKTKLDLITNKHAHKHAMGKHCGSKLARRIVEQQQPILHLGGHVHEGYGQQKVGKTLCINTGSAAEGKAVIINLDEEKGKIESIKFVK